MPRGCVQIPRVLGRALFNRPALRFQPHDCKFGCHAVFGHGTDSMPLPDEDHDDAPTVDAVKFCGRVAAEWIARPWGITTATTR